jgi:hypothetical protein
MALSLAELDVESGSLLPARNTMFILVIFSDNHSYVQADSLASAHAAFGGHAVAVAGADVTVIQG